MATYTTNYNLEKPALSELYDIGVQNNNMDAIDAQMKQNADDISAAEYHVGDVLNLSPLVSLGVVRNSKKDIYFTIPLAKPIGADVTTLTLSGGFTISDTSGSTILNNSDLTDVGTIQNTYVRDFGITVLLRSGTTFSPNNNAPVVIYGNSTARLTLS